MRTLNALELMAAAVGVIILKGVVMGVYRGVRDGLRERREGAR